VISEIIRDDMSFGGILVNKTDGMKRKKCSLLENVKRHKQELKKEG